MRGHFANDVGPVGIVLIMKRFLLCGVAALSLAAVAAPALAGNVAIVQGSFYTPNLYTSLVAAGETVTEISSYTAASLAGFDAVIHYGNSFTDTTALDTYVNGGGRLILTPRSGLNYSLPPAFPALTQHAARAFYLLNDKASLAAVPFAQAVLKGYFQYGRDISNIDVIAGMVCDQTDNLGHADAVRELLKTDKAKTLLQNAIAAAVDQKVFGSPFVVIDGEPFFGVDRLPQIAVKLAATV